MNNDSMNTSNDDHTNNDNNNITTNNKTRPRGPCAMVTTSEPKTESERLSSTFLSLTSLRDIIHGCREENETTNQIKLRTESPKPKAGG